MAREKITTVLKLEEQKCVIGGYTRSDLALRYYILPQLHDQFILNLLELIASEIIIHNTCHVLGGNQHILALKNSSISLVWMLKVSLNPYYMPLHDVIDWWTFWEIIQYSSFI